MSDDEKKKKCMRQHFSRKILAVLKEGMPEDFKDLYGEGISYEEAKDVLMHTISELDKLKLLF